MSKRRLHLDLETFSECDLGDAGVFRYAEHPSTEVLVMGYAFDNEDVKQWFPGTPLPDEVVQHVLSGGEIRAHNAQFERVVLNGVAGEAIGFPFIEIAQTVCTAAKCAANGIPRSLSDASKALGTFPKSDAGRMEMLQLCKPRKPTKNDLTARYTLETAPEKFEAMYAYNLDDVKAERDVDHAVPDLSVAEQAVYELDQIINARGIAVDLVAIDNIMAVVTEYKEFLAFQCELETGLKPTQRDKIAEWIRAEGRWPGLVDMQADTVKALVANEFVPDEVKKVLRIYSTYNAKAITKYAAILAAVCKDSRLRGMFMYHGANTGRWSSLIVQLQNLFRPVIDDPETAIEAFATRDLDWIRTLYGGVDPIKVAASCVRSVLVAAHDKELVFPDYAGIESRFNAWLFGEDWKLDAFRKYDRREGPDSYVAVYSKFFLIPVKDVKPKQRQVGKVVDLACGYEGGVGAFVTMSETYGLNLAEMTEAVLPTLPREILETSEWMWGKYGANSGLDHDTYVACDGLKQLWRAAHPAIRQGWKDLKDAAEKAVQFPGTAFSLQNGRVAFKVVNYKGRNWLYLKLPSGRLLAYYNPRWIESKTIVVKNKWGKDEERIVPGELRYWGVDTDTRRWMEISSYGGRWCENIVQAGSRDILVNGMLKLEQRGYPLVGSVHDEPIAEVPKDFGSFDEAGAIICELPDWAAGLPVAVGGHRGNRYRK